MSRIGIKPIKIEDGVEVKVSTHEVDVKGPLGELKLRTPSTVSVKAENDEVIVETKRGGKQAGSDHGTIRMLISNMIYGVKNGYKKELELVGMGYRANMEGDTLVMHLGWTHPIKVEPPEGIKFAVKDTVFVEVSGIDKQLVGLWAAKIRSIRKPEPYKGKGIKYVDEIIRRKTSKTVKEES
ncbi:50S ribosomal protein L6 [Candidatus Dojkabacteria bacterium]|nr:50S ribosomal protein L6 [Candidatus Dojkabacteria bacterium]